MSFVDNTQWLLFHCDFSQVSINLGKCVFSIICLHWNFWTPMFPLKCSQYSFWKNFRTPLPRSLLGPSSRLLIFQNFLTKEKKKISKITSWESGECYLQDHYSNYYLKTFESLYIVLFVNHINHIFTIWPPPFKKTMTY